MTTFVLAVDHRSSLRRWLTGLGVAGPEVEAQARRLKVLCVRALTAAAPELTAEETAMLLLDEEFGAEAIASARAVGLPFVIPAERSGESEFGFQHGRGFAAAIDAVDPSAVKALVRYNPAGDPAANARSRAGLLELSAHLAETGRPLMLELLVPPTPEQAQRAGDFDVSERPGLTVAAIEALAAEGIAPHWWKLEGNREPADAAAVAVAAAASSDRGALVLGRGQDRDAVRVWTRVAAQTPGYDGFAVGRTLWTGPFRALVGGEIDAEAAVARISANYLNIVDSYREADQRRT